MKEKRNNGITLIALVITIIILIILATISINLILGENGLIGRTNQSRAIGKLGQMEEEATQIYWEKEIGRHEGNNGEVTMEDIVAELQDRGYTIEKVASSDSTITGITLDEEKITMSTNDTATINITLESTGGASSYYAVIDGKYYKMSYDNGKVTIERTPSDINPGDTAEEITATVKSGTSVTIDSVQGTVINLKSTETIGQTVITVTCGTYTKECKVSVVTTPTESSTPEASTTFSTDHGTIDIIWLNTLNQVQTTPNTPILTSNGESMTPVTWHYDKDTSTWQEDATPQSEWYNYAEGKWANAVTDNGSYFVWIPRFAYRITYYEFDPITIDSSENPPTGYYDGWGMWKVDGTLKYKLDDGATPITYGGNKYILHPAFTTNLDLGGWDSELSGFWFAKYEMSGSKTNLVSAPDQNSLRNTGWPIGTMYQACRDAKYGFTGTSENILSGGKTYSHTSYMSSHLVKNSEWGAVAYLTHSKYGLEGHEIGRNDNSSYKTGYYGTSSLYNTAEGLKASTTGNIYGIYDMSGGTIEYSASYNKNYSGSYFTSTTYGADLIKEAKDSSGTLISTKYVTAYENGTSSYNGATVYTVGKVGDATKEARKSSDKYAWFGNTAYVVDSSYPFFLHGSSSGSTNGVFSTYSDTGVATSGYGFRSVLTPAT